MPVFDRQNLHNKADPLSFAENIRRQPCAIAAQSLVLRMAPSPITFVPKRRLPERWPLRPVSAPSRRESISGPLGIKGLFLMWGV